MLRLGIIVLGAEDVERAVAFWSEALGYSVTRHPGSENDFTELVPPSGEGVSLGVQRSATPAGSHPRTHLDLAVDSPAEQQAETDRLVGLGASLADWDSYPADPDFVVLADTEGNFFCIVDDSHD